MDLQEVIALSDLISSSVQQIVSLSDDGTLNSLTDPDPTVRKHTLQITAAASQLISIIRPPEQYIIETSIAYHVSSSLNFAVELGIAEVIRENGHSNKHALHVKEIARICHVNDRKLARVLRLLATHHIFDEVSPNVFANNRLSIVLDTGKSVQEMQEWPDDRYDGTSGIAALVSLVAGDCMRTATGMSETLIDPTMSSSFSPLHAPFSRAWNTELTMFDWLNLPENKYRLKRFGNAMNGMSGTVPVDAVLRGFDWNSLPPGSVVVDVGGGVGAASLPIVRNCPNIRLVIQDAEPVVAEAPKFWLSHCPEAVEEGRVSFQAQDFFLPQPTSSKTATVFLVRMIMHNWPDHECLKILQRIRAAASPDSKLVLVDDIMMYACRQESKNNGLEDTTAEGNRRSDNSAPEPLLGNWGAANKLSYAFDVMMLCNHNAGERTLGEFEDLLRRTGWDVEQVHQFHESWLPQIVATPSHRGHIGGNLPTKTSCLSEMSTGTDSSSSNTIFEPEDDRVIADSSTIYTVVSQLQTDTDNGEMRGRNANKDIIEPRVDRRIARPLQEDVLKPQKQFEALISDSLSTSNKSSRMLRELGTSNDEDNKGSKPMNDKTEKTVSVRTDANDPSAGSTDRDDGLSGVSNVPSTGSRPSTPGSLSSWSKKMRRLSTRLMFAPKI